MRFKQFVTESDVTESGVVHNKGIEHIEALPHSKFIEAIRNLSQFIASEKLDGSNLVFGFESNGTFYTSRESKNGKRMHSTNDYSDNAADNGFKSAHAALKSVESSLKQVINNGEAVEVEVLFGRQPNAIVYGSNHLAFLRMLVADNKKTPDQSKIKQLGEVLKGKTVKVEVPITTTDDGINIKRENIEQTWKFASVSYIDTHKFVKVSVSKEIDTFEKWLKQESTVPNLTNADVIEIKLTSIPKESRPTVKKAREDAIKTANDKFKLPIKERFLDEILRKLKPTLRDVDVEDYEDIGIEGVVLLNPKTLEQLKIVDKDVFTIINQFNHAIRNQIKQTVKGREQFSNMLPKDTDVFGDMLKRIASSIGIEELGDYMKIKRVLRKYDGGSAEKTASNVANAFKKHSLSANKKEIAAAINEGLADLKNSLEHFQQNWKEYEMVLKTGKRVKYTKSIHERTLMVFAEARREMQDMLNSVNNAKTLGDIVVALFGKQLKGIH